MPLDTGKMIVKCHPYGFKSFMIVGGRGIGKSTYALIVLYEVFLSLGYSKVDSWNNALDSCKFHISDVIQFLRESTLSDNPYPVLLWDDLGVHASGTKYFLNMKQVDMLKATLDTIRTAISGLIMTCPNPHGLLSVLRHYDDYQIAITYSTKGGHYRNATAYKWRTLPSGKRLISTQYRDQFNCYIPNWVFKQYMKGRRKALITTLDTLGKGMKTDKEEK